MNQKRKRKKTKLQNYNSVKGYTKPVEYRTKKQYFVYVLECENDSFYVGICLDIDKRFKQHIGGYGAEFTKEVYELAKSVCKKVVLEQPKTIMQRFIGKRSQKIQPYQFGHGETKETWLWVNGLPLLNPTDEVPGRENKVHKMPPGPNRGKERSKTYSGIEKAMAQQWGK
jgi:predicted GIY-YIG superfamily endonuclease